MSASRSQRYHKDRSGGRLHAHGLHEAQAVLAELGRRSRNCLLAFLVACGAVLCRVMQQHMCNLCGCGADHDTPLTAATHSEQTSLARPHKSRRVGGQPCLYRDESKLFDSIHELNLCHCLKTAHNRLAMAVCCQQISDDGTDTCAGASSSSSCACAKNTGGSCSRGDTQTENALW